MQRLEVSGAVRPIYGSLGVRRLKLVYCPRYSTGWFRRKDQYFESWRYEKF